jgi:hypothetical protein
MELSDEETSAMSLALLFKIPLYRLLNEMPYEEYMAWISYLEQHPPGIAEDYRAAMIIASTNPKAPLEKIFPSLVRPEKPVKIGDSLVKSAFMSRLNNSVGGDKIPI